MTKAEQLGLEKLSTSGLDKTDASRLKIEFVANASKLHPSFDPVAALKLPYIDPFTGKPLACRPKWPSFYRLRYLDQPAGFDALTEGKKQRYTQEPDTGVCAYFPTNIDNWKEILKDYEQPLIITEGELKAAKACKEGFPTIGLGGVYNFRSTRSDLPFLHELEAVNWARRNVYVIYDSDFRTNENVCQAINMLSEELLDRGAVPHYVGLPDVYEEDEGKTGLDDFLVERDASALRQLLGETAQPLTLSKALWEFNKRVVYVRDPGLVVVQKSGQKLAPAAFKDHAFSQAKYHEYSYNADGTIKLKKLPAAPAWLKWEFRREADRMTYAPGEPRMLDTTYNAWPGWGCEPKKGKVKPWLQLVDHLFTDAEPAFKQWFLRWCAYPIQHPGTKMFSSVVIHGTVHGTGKSLIGMTLGKIYGKNYAKINQRDLERDYNPWAENKQFVLGEEITGSNKRSEADMLKDLITQKTAWINIKYVPTYEIPDCINYLFTSNHPDAFFLEDRDRRYAIHEVLVDVLPEQFYRDYISWLEADGAAALFDYLLNLDLGDFNPAAPAFASAAKARMIMDSKSDLGAWCHGLLTDPDHFLKLGDVPIDRDLFTSKELLDLYDPMEKTRVTAQGMGTNLKKVGIRQVCNGAPIRANGEQNRYFAIRNANKWLKAKPAEIASHLEAEAKKKKKY